MKHKHTANLVFIISLAATLLAQSNEGWPSAISSDQLAILRWYPANLSTAFSLANTHNVGPHAVAFDGANICSAQSL